MIARRTYSLGFISLAVAASSIALGNSLGQPMISLPSNRVMTSFQSPADQTWGEERIVNQSVNLCNDFIPIGTLVFGKGKCSVDRGRHRPKPAGSLVASISQPASSP
jgi:hypothetical protein